MTDDIRARIERSSLGDRRARRARARVDDDTARALVERAKTAGALGESGGLRTYSPSAQPVQPGPAPTLIGGTAMAKNTGKGFRRGEVTGRSQTRTAAGNYVKRNAGNGQFMDQKADKAPFKGVRREH